MISLRYTNTDIFEKNLGVGCERLNFVLTNFAFPDTETYWNVSEPRPRSKYSRNRINLCRITLLLVTQCRDSWMMQQFYEMIHFRCPNPGINSHICWLGDFKFDAAICSLPNIASFLLGLSRQFYLVVRTPWVRSWNWMSSSMLWSYELKQVNFTKVPFPHVKWEHHHLPHYRKAFY